MLKRSGVRFYRRKAEYIKNAIENFEYVEVWNLMTIWLGGL